MRPAVFALAIAAGLFGGCEAVCGCPPEFVGEEVVYGRVESATGSGIPTAVVLYRFTGDVCAPESPLPFGEIDVGADGQFRDVIYSSGARQKCLELRAFDPASGQADTVSTLVFVDFNSPDSTGVVLRLP
jgi:hypothetical protein